MTTVLLIIFYLLTPALIIWLCKKFPVLDKIGAVLLLYLVGLVAGNSGLMPDNTLDQSVQNTLSEITVLLAIPLLLFSCDFRRWSIRKSLLTLVCGVVGVVTAIVLGYLIFKPYLGPESYKIGGMLTGVYTGGTPNLAALKLALNVPQETYIMINTYDMVVSLLYLVFLMSFGIRLFRLWLPASKVTDAPQNVDSSTIETAEGNLFCGRYTRHSLDDMVKGLLIAAFIFAASYGIAMLLTPSDPTIVIVLALTTLGIIASFVRPIRRLERTFDTGMYLIYIFSVVVASLAKFNNFNLVEGLYLLIYIAFAVFVSLLVQALIAKSLKIDADTMIISSVALINSPMFVPMIANSMRNKSVMITGFSIGLVGYAIGNYLGPLVCQLLKAL